MTKMPSKAVTEAHISIPSSFLESQLLLAPQKPEALYRVVNWVWSSLVYAARPDSVADMGPVPSMTNSANAAAAVSFEQGGDVDHVELAPATPCASTTGLQGETQALSLQPSFSASTTSPLRCVAVDFSSSGAIDPASPCLEHTLAGCATSSEVMNYSDGTKLNQTLTAATATGQPFIAKLTPPTASAPSSTAELPLSVNSRHEVPTAQLSPLVLRLLLWWASQPLLPSMHGEERSGDSFNTRYAWPSSKWSTDDSSGIGDNSNSGFFVPTQQRRQLEADEAHQLRLRIAAIFDLLYRRGFGVVISDALVYGRCHDASEAAAARCNFVFGSCPNAAWRAATAFSATILQKRVDSTDNGVTEPRLDSPYSSTVVKVSTKANGCDGDSTNTRYSVGRLLRALVDLHNVSRESISSSRKTSAVVPASSLVSDADITAIGQLLRSLLRCPRLYERVLRLFDRDNFPRRVAKPMFHNAPSTTLVSCTPSNSPPLSASWTTVHTQAGTTDAVEDAAAAGSGNLRLQSFLPALTHPSLVVSSEAWRTVGMLLFPSTTVAKGTRELLQRTPECPVQRLLASALALSDDCVHSFSASAETGGASKAPSASPSHPMARNSALRILHVLCVSKNMPPASQVLFTQCPALLWRVLKLAEALCKGIPVANMALVSRVLADYVMASVQPSTASAVSATPTPIQQLLVNNKDALITLFASTYALWGTQCWSNVVSAVDSGGDYAEAVTDAAYDEKDLRRAVQMLRI